jgi:long-chain acyl-CoA synthetase
MAYRSIPEMFLAACKRGGDKPALRHKVHGRWQALSWRQWEDAARNVGRGLIALGVARGERVAILSQTRLEWVLADLGIICAGAATVPIYQSNLPKECEHVLVDSEAAVVFVEDERQLEKVLAVREALPALKKIVLIAGHKPADPMVMRFDDLVALGKQADPAELQRRIEAAGPADLASLVYTSGTTGKPKGAMLSHAGFVFVAGSVSGILKRSSADETLLFLPLAHIFARIVEFVCIHDGVSIAFAESIERLLDNLAEVRPTFMASVPRIYEKIYAKAVGDVQEAGGLKKAVFDFSLAAGRELSRSDRKKEDMGALAKLKYRVADRLVFSKLKQQFGGRLEFFVSGGAPLSKEIAEFFHAAGILILEGYGLTETTAVTNVNRPGSFKFGTVGQPVPGVEQKIAPDGEVLSRSPGTMQGYFRRDDETREVLDADGWFHTGDIGEFDDDGFLRITDRKKDIIITAGGKNIAPQAVESHLKNNPLISQVMVYGDKRKYLTALITLNYDEAAKIARVQGISFRDPRELAAHPALRERVAAVVEEKNRELASYESIKRFAIVADDFTQESGELTPTLKIKRKVVTQKYKQLLDGFYEEKLYE